MAIPQCGTGVRAKYLPACDVRCAVFIVVLHLLQDVGDVGQSKIHLKLSVMSRFFAVCAKRECMGTVQISDVAACNFSVNLKPACVLIDAMQCRQHNNNSARKQIHAHKVKCTICNRAPPPPTTHQPSFAFDVIALVQIGRTPTSVWRLALPLMILSQPRKSTLLVRVLVCELCE